MSKNIVESTERLTPPCPPLPRSRPSSLVQALPPAALIVYNTHPVNSWNSPICVTLGQKNSFVLHLRSSTCPNCAFYVPRMWIVDHKMYSLHPTMIKFVPLWNFFVCLRAIFGPNCAFLDPIWHIVLVVGTNNHLEFCPHIQLNWGNSWAWFFACWQEDKLHRRWP